MATAPQGFIAAAAPTKIARVSNTTLFHLAAKYFGNPLYWTNIAAANGLTDPWVGQATAITIPNIVPAAAPDGILD